MVASSKGCGCFPLSSFSFRYYLGIHLLEIASEDGLKHVSQFEFHSYNLSFIYRTRSHSLNIRASPLLSPVFFDAKVFKSP